MCTVITLRYIQKIKGFFLQGLLSAYTFDYDAKDMLLFSP